MRVFLDEGVAEPLAKHLEGHFEVFIINDKNLEAQQQLARRPFATLILRACNLPVILPQIATIRTAVDQAVSGTIVQVDCGKFCRKRP